MDFKLVVNKQLDMSFLKRELCSKEEMLLVNPTASFPFEEEYWINFYNMPNRKSYSLLYYQGHEPIGHAALQQNLEENGIVHLCFVLVGKKYRRRGITQKFLSEVESFLKENFCVNKYYLNVRKVNSLAINCYTKFGFNIDSIKEFSLKMVKEV